MLWASQMSTLSAQPFHTPTSNFTFSPSQTRLNKPFHFSVGPCEIALFPHDLHFYSLVICKEDLIRSFLSTHKVSVTMGMQGAPLLRGTEARSIVARDNSCLYLWQANRLIKGGHVCFCARYLALSKHCHISTPQPSQTQHFLPSCVERGPGICWTCPTPPTPPRPQALAKLPVALKECVLNWEI